MRKIFTLLGLASLLIANEKATVKQLFSVQTVKVKKEQKFFSRKNYGYVKPSDALIYDVSPRFGGYIVKLNADKIYQKVRKNEILATVYSPEVYKAKQDYLNSYKYMRLKHTNGMLKSARLSLKLLDVPDSEIDNVLKEKKVSKYTNIISPVSGYIFNKNLVHKSAFNKKQKLFTIVNLDKVWVEAKIYEEDLKWVKTTKDFEIKFKSLSKTYKGKNPYIYPSLDPKEATLTLRLEVDNRPNDIFPGMYATIISKTEAKTYLTVPKTAVIRKNGKYFAFLKTEFKGEYEPVEVSVEPIDDYTYIVKSGLKEGDEVVKNGMFMMDSDAQINGLY